MNEDNIWLLLFGPAGAVGLYWTLYRHYRNTDKSHAFERETAIDAKPVKGSERKISEIKGTRESRIKGENVSAYRKRVQRQTRDAGSA